MRQLVVFAISFFIFCPHICLSRELNGNLDYSLKSENGIAKLKITNKVTDTLVQLKSVVIIFPPNNEEAEEKRIVIPSSQNLPFTESVTIELGADSDLAQQLLQIKHPNNKVSQLKSTNVSEDACYQPYIPTGYQHCESIGFFIEINTEYENGSIKSSNIDGVSMNYII